MTSSIAVDSFPYFTEEHAMLRATIRRFIADRVLPHVDAWEEQGFVPREVLREMGTLGLLGMRYAPEYGGSGLDTLANAILAEELGRSTCGGSVRRTSVTCEAALTTSETGAVTRLS